MRVFTFIFACILIGCVNNPKPEDRFGNHTDAATGVDALHSRDSITELRTEIINEQFANAPLGEFDFTNKDLSSYFKGKYDNDKSTVGNRFTDTIDTLVYFKRGESLVRFYKTDGKVFLDSLNVSDKNFVMLAGGIDIGWQKEEFLHYFGVSPALYADSISVSNGENESITFVFFNGKLSRVFIAPWH